LPPKASPGTCKRFCSIFFNDSVAVGWVRGGFIEIAAEDPEQGAVFYVVDRTPFGRVTVRRDDTCLPCHHSHRTAGVARMIEPMGHEASGAPMGWLVRDGPPWVDPSSGQRRRAGLRLGRREHSDPAVPPANLRYLRYLTPCSDIAALMVFEHQMQTMNLLTRLGWETRVARHEGTLDGTRSVIRERVNEVADYMLFVDEAPITSRITGSSGFADAFSARGPFDRRRQSLRQLNLTTRLLEYPCSYLIHSDQFDRLPDEARSAVYQRLREILSGSDKGSRYGRLSAETRRAIVEILRETRPGLPAYFGRLAVGSRQAVGSGRQPR
jgi:hypothetical protein